LNQLRLSGKQAPRLAVVLSSDKTSSGMGGSVGSMIHEKDANSRSLFAFKRAVSLDELPMKPLKISFAVTPLSGGVV